jgi:hypothetical protein
MYHDMNGWAWFGMTLGALFWILLIGIAVYVAVRFAHRQNRQSREPGLYVSPHRVTDRVVASDRRSRTRGQSHLSPPRAAGEPPPPHS